MVALDLDFRVLLQGFKGLFHRLDVDWLDDAICIHEKLMPLRLEVGAHVMIRDLLYKCVQWA